MLLPRSHRHEIAIAGCTSTNCESADAIPLLLLKCVTLWREMRHYYGYAKKKKIKLYGKELEIISDPVNPEGEDVFVDAREKGTDDVRRVQVPRNVVEMAKKAG